MLHGHASLLFTKSQAEAATISTMLVLY